MKEWRSNARRSQDTPEPMDLEALLLKIAAENPGPPRPGWFYQQETDDLHVYLESVMFYGEWICKGLTIYRAMDDKRIIGFHIDGVRGEMY